MRSDARRRRPRSTLPITREISGGQTIYRLNGRRISQRAEIERIEAIAIPPAWNDVEIARSGARKVLARGIDAAGRMQAIYYPRYRQRQERRKFERLERFGRALPKLRARVERDLQRRRLGEDRVAAGVVHLIDLEFFRIGNDEYARRNGSYGITTLRWEHVEVSSRSTVIDFMGKSGKRQRRRVEDARAARLLARLKEEMPGAQIFHFWDDDDQPRQLNIRHVNNYVKRHMGEEFTAKDFRTWGGTIIVADALLSSAPKDLATAKQRTCALREGIRLASERLGNTPAVTKSSYVDPRLLRVVDQPKSLERARAARARMRPRRYFDVAEQSAMTLLAELGKRTQ